MRLRPVNVVAGVVGLGMARLILTTTGAAFMATRRPDLALALNKGEAHALVEAAQRQLDQVLVRQRERATAGAEPRSASARGAPAAPVAGGQAAGQDSERAPGNEVRREPAETREPPLAFTDEEIEAISRSATAALRRAPLDARSLRILAQIADATGDKERKRQLLQAIIQRTKHEPLAGYWLMLEAMDRKDYAGAVGYADIVLSKNPDLAQ